jgi:hypothetical protein
MVARKKSDSYNNMVSIRHVSLVLVALCLLQFRCEAFMIQSPATGTYCHQRVASFLFSTTTSNNENDEKAAAKVDDSGKSSISASNVTEKGVITEKKEEEEDNEEEEDDEYEYEEYEMLKEQDFLGSEWLVGTCWENNNNNIKETWVRLATKGDKNLAVWGDNSEGTWSLDVASQFLAISKEFLWGKQIWAGVVDDYYFVQGTVRGWTYLTPASVVGQWQAKRLGVDPEEAGTAPWFQVEDGNDDDESNEETTKSEAKDQK